MAHYLGPLGALRPIPSPQPGRTVTTERTTNEWSLITGQRVVQRSPRARRTWSLVLGAASAPEEVAYLAACASGAVPGPLYLHLDEAAQTNLLPAHLAAPGLMGDLTLGSVLSTVPVGMPGAAGVTSTAVVQQSTSGAWSPTVPVRAGVAHRLSAWGSAGGPLLDWRTVNASGGQVTTGLFSAGGVAGAWRGSTDFTPSATAVGIQVRTYTGTRAVGGLRLTEGPHDPVWLPGHGVPQIVVEDPAQVLQLVMSGHIESDYTVTLKEVS